MRYSFTTELKRLPGESAYFACYLPQDVAGEITLVTEGMRGGFGSVRVRVRLGASQWKSSIFRDARIGSYLLLVNKQVRQAERLSEGDRLRLELELIDF